MNSPSALGSALNGVLPSLVRAFTAQNPQVKVDIRQLDTGRQLIALHDRRLDIGFIRATQPVPGMVITTVSEEPLVAVISAHHPLAARAEVSLRALANEPFVFWPRQANVGFYDEFVARCRGQGFNPDIRFEAGGAETLLDLIAAGLGVSIQPESYRNLARDGVAFRPLAGRAPISTLQVAHRYGDTTPVLHRFLTVINLDAARAAKGTPPTATSSR